MKKWLTTLVLLAAALFSLAAQDNPYGIDPECHKLLEEAMHLEGKIGFDSANSELLSKAIEKGDTKAQTLYYVERLKNATALLKDKKNTTQAEDENVLKYMEDLKRVASDLGETKFFYQAYDIVQSYYYIHGKLVHTMELLQDMREQAVARKESYGIWMGNRYIISLYIAQNDYISAKKYIKEAIR
ncbi:MAG: hypothetical protein J6Y66_01390, partial [Bacteroidales bacterium]|nr:hypothetical protein [Bacteroidales bacterium]